MQTPTLLITMSMTLRKLKLYILGENLKMNVLLWPKLEVGHTKHFGTLELLNVSYL